MPQQSQRDQLPTTEPVDTPTLGVVGAGVIGLSVAWRAALSGWRVTVYDPQPLSGASWVAGGMLSPLSEAWPGESAQLELGVESLRLWPGFLHELRAHGDVHSVPGVLTVALDSADARELGDVADWLASQGHPGLAYARGQARERAPELSRAARGGLYSDAEFAVDNRAVGQALRVAAAAAGVAFVARNVEDVSKLSEDQVVIANGFAARQLCSQAQVRPVKGEIVRLRRRASSAPAPAVTIRARVHGRAVYVVPRADGVVVGATQYEARDTEVTVAGLRDLLTDVDVVVPGLSDYEVVELGAGLRPVTPDGLPLIGRVSERVVLAGGHGRNGFLLAPVTADAVVALLGGTTVTPCVKHADATRFG